VENEEKGTPILPGHKNCFYCDPDVEHGLKLKIAHGHGGVVTNLLIDDRFQGYEGVVHGGIVMGVLDELMWWAILTNTKRICMTLKVDMSFARPIRCGALYFGRGRLEGVDGADLRASATIGDASDRICAVATGVFREVTTVPVLQDNGVYRKDPIRLVAVFKDVPVINEKE
jgi:acyl-coenzyme A thioesterase PaaI-like protein